MSTTRDRTIRLERSGGGPNANADEDGNGNGPNWAPFVTAASFILIPAASFGAPAAYEYSRSGDPLRAVGAGIAGIVAVGVTGRAVDYVQNRRGRGRE